MNVDTLFIARELRGAELTGPQAEAIAAAIGKALNASVETDANRTTIGTEMKNQFGLLDQRLEAMEQRLTARIEAMRSSLLIWLIGVIIAGGGLFLTIGRIK